MKQMALGGNKLSDSERLITKLRIHLLGDCAEIESFEQRRQIGVQPWLIGRDGSDLPMENSSEATPQFIKEEHHGALATSAQDTGGAHAGHSPELLLPPYHTHRAVT